jgi:hypothetical protein
MALPLSVAALSRLVRAFAADRDGVAAETRPWTLIVRAPPVIMRAFAADNEGFTAENAIARAYR